MEATNDEIKMWNIDYVQVFLKRKSFDENVTNILKGNS
jgi:hypothetical protein